MRSGLGSSQEHGQAWEPLLLLSRDLGTRSSIQPASEVDPSAVGTRHTEVRLWAPSTLEREGALAVWWMTD